MDYLAPQIYWNIGYSIADYQVLAQWWSDILSDTDTELYIGLADYKSAEASGDPSSVWNGTAELKRQMDLNRKIGGIGGEIHFRYRMMKDDVQIPSFLADYYGADASEDDGRPGTDPEDGKEEPDDGTQTEGMFSDVAADSWYYDAVSYVVSEGLMNGISDNLFSPAAEAEPRHDRYDSSSPGGEHRQPKTPTAFQTWKTVPGMKTRYPGRAAGRL